MTGSDMLLPDNFVLPFEIKPRGVRGKLVRLGEVVRQ